MNTFSCNFGPDLDFHSYNFSKSALVYQVDISVSAQDETWHMWCVKKINKILIIFVFKMQKVWAYYLSVFTVLVFLVRPMKTLAEQVKIRFTDWAKKKIKLL